MPDDKMSKSLDREEQKESQKHIEKIENRYDIFGKEEDNIHRSLSFGCGGMGDKIACRDRQLWGGIHRKGLQQLSGAHADRRVC